ncbi:MAG: AMP-binding protein [Bacteroidota bacterium]
MGNILMDKNQLIDFGLTLDEADKIISSLKELETLESLEKWRAVCRTILKPEMPITLHQYLHRWAFNDWDESLSPIPAWSPDANEVEESNIHQIMSEINIDNYEDFYSWSIKNPIEFNRLMINRLGIVFNQEPIDIMNMDKGVESPRWFYGGKLNIVESCFKAASDATAIIYERNNDAPGKLSYSELHEMVGRVKNSLNARGVKQGDRVAIAMPMTVEAAAIYLGIIAAGCSAVTVADSFSSEEMQIRFDLAKPVCVFCQDYLIRLGKRIPLYERVVQALNAPCIVIRADENNTTDLRSGDISWKKFLINDSNLEFVHANPDDEITLLFSSGTTGNPKAIPWTQTTPIKSANDAHLHHDIHAGDVLCWPTNLGWMMGPWLIFSALLNNAAIALNSSAPTTREFGKFVSDAKVTMLGLVPSIVSAWQSSDCIRGIDWSTIKAFSSTGETSNYHEMFFLMSLAGYKPVIEYCGGTEIGGGYIAGTLVQPSVPAMFSTPALGSDWLLLDEDGELTESGEIFFKPPTLGLSTSLVNGNHHDIYFAGTPLSPTKELLRRHGDHIEKLPGGYYRAHGRVDDTMNLGGIKVSNIQIEEILSAEPEVKELAAVAVPAKGGGPNRLVIYVYSVGTINVDTLKIKYQKLIRTKLNPLFKIFDVVQIDKLPRTASNKVMRRKLRSLYEQRVEREL